MTLASVFLLASLASGPVQPGAWVTPLTGPPRLAQEVPPPPGEARRPNLVLILADDLGFGDLGLQGCTDIATPNIDSLARDGVRCTNAYASGPRCAPTRAGLMVGRYQERFGCELSADDGLPREEVTLADRLGHAGYATGLVGKWHLGTRSEHDPLERGFDEFFGFLGGSNPSLPRGALGTVPNLLRGREPAEEKEYLTDALAREAVSFVERHADEPFFLYLAFNAPHRPLEAPEVYLARHAGIADPKRRAYAAMISAMDDAVGRVLAALEEHGLAESTLVVFLNDNGAATRGRQRSGASNAPLRGRKGSLLEGGIRVPFLARWTGTLPAGHVFEPAVISLDVTATALALAGVEVRPEWRLDGVDLLPYLTGRTSQAPHEELFWAFRRPSGLRQWAVRRGDLKLVCVTEHDPAASQPGPASLSLFDVARDPQESTDLIGSRPEEARELERLWKRWSAGLPPGPADD